MEAAWRLRPTPAAVNEQTATELMLVVHHKGFGVAGLYTYEIAETKAFQVNEFSKENGYPLKTTVEKE